MKYFVQICVYFVLQHLPFTGTVTIDFNSIGYIGESIVLQCQDTLPTNASSVKWFWGGSLMDISSSRYTETKTPTGFNVTISSLVTADAGEYKCSIDFHNSGKKGLTIQYNTKDVDITRLIDPKAIQITFIAFPRPKYEATVKEDGVQLDVKWTVYTSTQASGAVQFLLHNSTAFAIQNKIYTVHVNITSPVPLDVKKNITWDDDQMTPNIDDCALESALGIALSTGIFTICITLLIIMVILVKTGADKCILRLRFGIICGACIVCIVIFVTTFKPCALMFGLVLGLGVSIPYAGCIIVVVILAKKENVNIIWGEEDASKNPKQKINKEKKGKEKEGNQKEMVELKLPEDQADAD